MRLLELRGSSTSIESKPEALLQKSVGKLATGRRPLKKPTAAQVSPAAARLFPINSRPTVQPTLPRKPAIDLEQLQQRIDLLERRIQARLASQGDQAQRQDLDQLRQRVKLLERKLEGELWAAKQREYALLRMLAKPDRKTAIRQRLLELLSGLPPTAWRFCKTAGKQWWQDSQPLWWPKFATAWQEALYRARH
jgi:hypothetical protein